MWYALMSTSVRCYIIIYFIYHISFIFDSILDFVNFRLQWETTFSKNNHTHHRCESQLVINIITNCFFYFIKLHIWYKRYGSILQLHQRFCKKSHAKLHFGLFYYNECLILKTEKLCFFQFFIDYLNTQMYCTLNQEHNSLWKQNSYFVDFFGFYFFLTCILIFVNIYFLNLW